MAVAARVFAVAAAQTVRGGIRWPTFAFTEALIGTVATAVGRAGMEQARRCRSPDPVRLLVVLCLAIKGDRGVLCPAQSHEERHEDGCRQPGERPGSFVAQETHEAIRPGRRRSLR